MHCFVAEVECPRDGLAWLAMLEPHLAEDEHPSLQSAIHAHRASISNANIKRIVASTDLLHCATVHDLIHEVEQLEGQAAAYLYSTTVDNPRYLTTISRYNYYRAFLMKSRSGVWELLEATKHEPEIQLNPSACDTQSKQCREIVLIDWSSILESSA